MKLRNLLAILAIFLLVQLRGTASGQATGTIEGVVRDEGSGRPMGTANVILADTEHGVATQADGRFVLPAIAPGRYSITASHVGYESASQQVTVRAGDTSEVVLALTPAPIRLDGILVAADPALSAASSRTVRAFDLRTRPRRSSQQLLQTVPGLVVSQHAGGGKAEQIFLRGFDNDHGTDVSVSVDGMPVNMVSHGHGQGYADLQFLIPEIVEGIDVHKGPYFADFGNLANAGHVAFRTRQRLAGNVVNVEAGEFNTARYTVLYQLPAASHHGHSAYFAGDYYRTDGPFDHPQDLRRLTLFAKVRRTISPNTRLTLDVGGFSSTWDASGQIPERAVERGLISRWGAIDDGEGGQTSRHNVNLAFETWGQNGDRFKTQAYWSTYDQNLYSNFTFFRWDVEFGNMIEQSDARRVVGFNSSYTTDRSCGPITCSSTFAGGFRSDDIDTELWQVVERRRYWPLTDATIAERNYYLWARQDLILAPQWRLSLGLRADHFTFEVDDGLERTGQSIEPLIDIIELLRQRPQVHQPSASKALHVPLDQPHASGIADDVIFSPKANLTFSPTAAVDLFLNFGQGFHSNDARTVVTGQVIADQRQALKEWGATDQEIRQVFQQLNFDANQAGVTSLPRTTGAEVGVRTRAGRRLNLGSALWWIDVDEEYVYVADVGVPEQRGRTRRTGIDVEARLRLLPWLWADGDLNLSRGRLRDEPDEADRIPLAPTRTATGGLTVRRPDGYEGGLRFRHVGDRPAVADGSLTAQGHTLVDFTAARRWELFRVEVTAENLFDAEWKEAQFATESLLADEIEAAMGGDIPPPEIHFTPGNPFNVRLGISYSF